MNCSLDTNTVLSLVLPDRNEQRSKVEKLLQTQICEVADLVFVEVEFVLAKEYQFTRDMVINTISAISRLPNINCNQALLRTALGMYREQKSLSFVDCCLASYAILNKATPLYTFDKKLVNQSDGVARTP